MSVPSVTSSSSSSSSSFAERKKKVLSIEIPKQPQISAPRPPLHPRVSYVSSAEIPKNKDADILRGFLRRPTVDRQVQQIEYVVERFQIDAATHNELLLSSCIDTCEEIFLDQETAAERRELFVKVLKRPIVRLDDLSLEFGGDFQAALNPILEEQREDVKKEITSKLLVHFAKLYLKLHENETEWEALAVRNLLNFFIMKNK